MIWRLYQLVLLIAVLAALSVGVGAIAVYQWPHPWVFGAGAFGTLLLTLPLWASLCVRWVDAVFEDEGVQPSPWAKYRERMARKRVVPEGDDG